MRRGVAESIERPAVGWGRVGVVPGQALVAGEVRYLERRVPTGERLRSVVLRALRETDEIGRGALPRALSSGGAALDVHHVVAAALERARPSREVLGFWGVDVHSVDNAAILPRSFHQGHGLHRGEFLAWVNTRVLAADGVGRAVCAGAGMAMARRIFIDMLQKIGDGLVEGTGDPAAMGLQALLRNSERARNV